MIADFTIEPSSVALLVAALVAVATAIAYGKQRGVKEAQEKEATATAQANQAMQDRIEAQEGMITELRSARDDDRAEFDRKLKEQNDRHVEADLACRENVARLRGQLETIRGGLVEQVGIELGQRIDQAAAGVATTVGDRLIAHLDHGDRQ